MVRVHWVEQFFFFLEAPAELSPYCSLVAS